jgi:hypothetical protein
MVDGYRFQKVAQEIFLGVEVHPTFGFIVL